MFLFVLKPSVLLFLFHSPQMPLMDSSGSLIVRIVIIMFVDDMLLFSEMLVLLLLSVFSPIIFILLISHRVALITFSSMLALRSTFIDVITTPLFSRS